MEPDEREIREVHSTWITAVNAGDLVRLLTLMADDAVFLNPGRAPVGRDGFSANFSAGQQRVRISCSSELEEVVVTGDVAYTGSRDALSIIPRAGGKETDWQVIESRYTANSPTAAGFWRVMPIRYPRSRTNAMIPCVLTTG